MSVKDEIQSFPVKAAESCQQPKKQSKIAYTRDFLLSLSELDICKELPSGFDQSVLSDFEDASYGLQDRQRNPGNLPLQSFRRSEYGSSPPTRGDSSNYSRGAYGRWDNHSAGWNDRDSNSQSDRDSDTGRLYGNQSRRSWQTPEHDGLLGSGSLLRPSAGYTAGLSASKARSEQYQLNRSSEPYQPPRPYKAVPHAKRETKDSFNDETFGSSECTSQDRAEEERRRRASFELMRKEQQKALQEKQKQNPDKHIDGQVSDISELLEDTKDPKRFLGRSNDADESVTQPASNDSSKSSLQSQTSRPRVPPGFKNTVPERDSCTSFNPAISAEVGISRVEESLSHAKVKIQNGILDNQGERKQIHEVTRQQHDKDAGVDEPFFINDKKTVKSSADLKVSSILDASETIDRCEIIKSDTKKVTEHKTINETKQDHTASILDKIFGSASIANINGLSDATEHHDSERDDVQGSDAVQSSKFAHWFIEDEKKTTGDPSYGRANNLLSLFCAGDKHASQVIDVKDTQQNGEEFPFQDPETTTGHKTFGDMSALYHSSNQGNVPKVLTCEDLEQTILLEYSENGSNTKTSLQSWNSLTSETQPPKADIDNCASQHLLALLQKGTGLKDVVQSSSLDGSLLDKLHVSEGANVGNAADNTKEEVMENNLISGKSLTLETLFGSAFMKELQSVEAPVSVQRASVGSTRIDVPEQHGLSFGVIDDSLFSRADVGVESDRIDHENDVLGLNQRQQTKMDRMERWLFGDAQIEMGPSKQQTELVSKLDGFEGSVDVRLPDEESLISVSNQVNVPDAMFMSSGKSTKGEFQPSNRAVSIAEKLAALNTVFKDERPCPGQEGSSFVRGPYGMVEPEILYHNFHPQTSSHQVYPQINQARPYFHPLDPHPTHINAHMNSLAPEKVNHHDVPISQFPGSMHQLPSHHSIARPRGYDFPHHSMLQQMQIPGNFSPPHLVRELPRGSPVPPHHPSNQSSDFLQELNPMQGFPFGQRPPNFARLGMPMLGPDVSTGNNHPEALQRLIEMELRAKSKQAHPFAAVGHSQGMYGHDLDEGFRYR